MNLNNVEALAGELKSLVGYGAKAQHVLSRPQLVELASTRHPGLTVGALKQAVVEELKQAAGLLPEAEAEAVRELLLLSRRYGHLSAVTRRENAIVRLRANYSVEAWRRPDGPELDLMREFARVLIEGGDETSVAVA